MAKVPVLRLTVQAVSVDVPPSRFTPAEDSAVLPLMVSFVSVMVPPKLVRPPPKNVAELAVNVQSLTIAVPRLDRPAAYEARLPGQCSP